MSTHVELKGNAIVYLQQWIADEYALFRTKEDKHLNIFFVHGCNTQHIMGAGIAKQLRSEWPKVFEVDGEVYEAGFAKLGLFSIAEIHKDSCKTINIVNAYIQEEIGTNGRKVSYDAVEKVFNSLGKHINVLSSRNDNLVVFPAIGSGLAGGNWNIIYTIILQTLSVHNLSTIFINFQ